MLFEALKNGTIFIICHICVVGFLPVIQYFNDEITDVFLGSFVTGSGLHMIMIGR